MLRNYARQRCFFCTWYNSLSLYLSRFIFSHRCLHRIIVIVCVIICLSPGSTSKIFKILSGKYLYYVKSTDSLSHVYTVYDSNTRDTCNMSSHLLNLAVCPPCHQSISFNSTSLIHGLTADHSTTSPTVSMGSNGMSHLNTKDFSDLSVQLTRLSLASAGYLLKYLLVDFNIT